MKKIIDIIKKKEFLIGLGVGIAGFYAYNKYIKKQTISSADGDRFGDNIYGQGSCSNSDDTVCSQYCESVNGTFDSNDRKCYVNGIAYTGGYFSSGNRSKLQR